jgi:RNA polymerase sigma-70 factor (ECF subfamily)
MDARAVFEILVRDNAAMLTAYLRSVVRDPATVDDLFQETMLTAWRKLDDFDRGRPFGAWLRGIAARLVLADRRKRAAGLIFCDEATLQAVDETLKRVGLQKGDTFDEKLECLRDCLEALPEPYREAVRLRYREGLSPAGLMEQIHLSLEAQKKRLQRARAMLLDCLNGKLAALGGQTA